MNIEYALFIIIIFYNISPLFPDGKPMGMAKHLK